MQQGRLFTWLSFGSAPTAHAAEDAARHAGRRVAESLREQYGDPAKLDALRTQAARATAQARRPSAERARQDADDLQKELGLK
jgi:hypothetical protein